MENFFNKLAEVNSVINDFVWVKIGLFLLIGAGVLMTCCTKFFQVGHIGHWWKETIGSVFKRDSAATKKTDKKAITSSSPCVPPWQLPSAPAISPAFPRPSSSAVPALCSGCGLLLSLA